MADHKLKVSMQWSSAMDFDIAALYETLNGKQGIVYFGDLGSLDQPPYIRLSGDKGVNDAVGRHAEHMTIAKLDGLKQIWFFCWDYGMIEQGRAARFQESDLKLSVNKGGKSLSVTLDSFEPANVCALAKLTVVGDGENIKLGKLSHSGVLKGLYQIEQLQAVLAD